MTPEADQQVAHTLRRCGFGQAPTAIAIDRQTTATAVLDALLSNGAGYTLSADEADKIFDSAGDSNELSEELFAGFLDQMLDGANPLHERMTWYWHTHFTTNAEFSNGRLVWRQHHLMRRHALGNFVELAREITTDAAMLLYLDGAGSSADNPNENYAREFLELFALGRDGGYTEDDVRAAARILAGWHVDYESGEVEFSADDAYDRPVTFMGERRRWDLDSFIEFVCRRPACARHVSTRLHAHLVGGELPAGRLEHLAGVFRNGGYEIQPLLRALLSGDDFLEATNTRARQPIEWALGALQALGFTSVADASLEYWQLETLGQMPFYPPNVAGWPLDDRWASASQLIARTSVLLEWELPDVTIDSVEPTAQAVLNRCGIFSPSATTLAAMTDIENDYSEFDQRLELLFAVALTSPEFTLL